MHRTGWLLRLELPSDPGILCVVRSAMMRLTEEMGFPAAECRALTRAVDEALANVICHAYGGRPEQLIGLFCRRLESRRNGQPRAGLEILVEDHGASTDCEHLCGRSLGDLRPGGLGLHFIRSSVDVVQYKSNGGRNRLRLVKYLPVEKVKPPIAKGQ